MSNLYLNVSSNKQSAGPQPQDFKDYLLRSFHREGVLPLLAVIGLLFIVVLLEFSTGFIIRSFPLMVNSLHNILNVLALGFSLFAIIVARMPKDERFTFGYSRFEIIASFSNCCFLLFVCLFNVFHSVHEFIEAFNEKDEHNHIKSSHPFNPVVLFNSLRLIINLVGTIAFNKYSVLYPKQKTDPILTTILGWFQSQKGLKYKKDDDDDASPLEPNTSHSYIISPYHVICHSIYTLFVIEALILTTFVSFHFLECLHETNSEILFSIALLFYTLKKTGSVFSLTTDILLQALPASHEGEIKGLLKRVSHATGVLKIDRAQYWALSPNYLVISLALKVADEKVQSQAVHEARLILEEYFTEVLIQSRFEKVMR